MRLQHVSLCTVNLERMVDFYCKYFSAVACPEYHNPKSGLRSCFLEFDGGTTLEVMTRPGFTQKPRSYAAGYAHIAIHAGGPGGVDEVVQRLRDDGYTVVSDPRIDGQGYYESTVQDPDGNWLEITGGKAQKASAVAEA